MASASAAAAGAALTAGTASAIGGASAVMAAFSGGGSSGGDSGSSAGGTPFAQAAGFRGSSGGGGGGQGKPNPGLLASAASALGTAGRVSADAGANLAKGTADVAKAKAASLGFGLAERITDTTGGKIADAIKAQRSGMAEDVNMQGRQPAPSFGVNSLAAGYAESESEVEAFVNRRKGREGITTS